MVYINTTQLHYKYTKGLYTIYILFNLNAQLYEDYGCDKNTYFIS